MASGITGIIGFTDSAPEADAVERQGGFADPRHADIGEVATPYPWEEFPGESHGPYGMENGLLGDVDIASYAEPAGFLNQDPTADEQPVTRAANWPKGLPQSMQPDDATLDRREQSAEIHAQNMGASREAIFEPTLKPVQDDWELIDNTDPGSAEMVPLPGQLQAGGSGGWGSRDRIQSLAGQNEYGFDSAHMRRRYAQGPIPGNYMWLQPGSRPLVKTIPGTARVPIGVDSPFAGQNPGQSYDAQGGALLNLPASYQSPPEPALAASYSSGEAPTVDYW